MSEGDIAGSANRVPALTTVPPFRVGTLAVRPGRRSVCHDDGREETLEPRVMQVLIELVRAGGETRSRADLTETCWDGRLVSDHALNRVISRLRVLAAGLGQDSFRIETLSKVGYRLIDSCRPPAAIPLAAPDPLEPTVEVEAEVVSGSPAPAVAAPVPPLSRRTMLAGAVLAAGAAVAVSFANRSTRQTTGAADDGLTILVAPFAVDGGAPDLAWQARAATDQMRADLGRASPVDVMAATSSAALARLQLSAVEIARRTGADLMLEGALSEERGRLRLSLTLTDLKQARQIWAGGVDVAEGDDAGLRLKASGAVLEQIAPRLASGAPGKLETASRRDPEAYRLATEAQQLCDEVRAQRMRAQTGEALKLGDKADALARRALAIDPNDSGALLVLAQLARNGWTSALAAMPLTTLQRSTQAVDYVRSALRADPSDPLTLATLADYYRRFEWRWDDAEALFRRALAINPSLIDAHWAYSHQLATLGRAVEALEHALVLLRLDPENLWRRITLPRMLNLCGMRAEALRRYDAELAAAPDNLFLLSDIYITLLAGGDGAGMRALSGRVAALWQGREMPAPVAALADRIRAGADALGGHPDSFLRLLDAGRAELDETGTAGATIQGRARDDVPYLLAIEYAQARRFDGALAMLDRALSAQSLYWPATMPFGADPFPKPMADDPRFAAMWQRDTRLADAVARRRRAAETGQMASIGPGGLRSPARVPAALARRAREAAARPVPA